MDQFTARNALLTGLELIRRRPLLVLLWAAVLLVHTIVYVSAARELAVIAREGFASGRPVSRVSGQLLALSAVDLVISLVIAAVLWCSAFRAILRPADRRPLSFGSEELSVFAVWFITQIVVQIVAAALQLLMVSRFSAAVDVRLIVNVVTPVTILGLFWSSVASVWTFGRGQVAPFRCWTIARGRFWLLAGLVLGVAVLDRLAGEGVRLLATNFDHMFPVSHVSPTEPFGVSGPRLQDVFQIPALIRDGLLAAVGALEIAFIAGVVACAFRTSAAEPQVAPLSTVSGAS
jgi:hypothetical protein